MPKPTDLAAGLFFKRADNTVVEKIAAEEIIKGRMLEPAPAVAAKPPAKKEPDAKIAQAFGI